MNLHNRQATQLGYADLHIHTYYSDGTMSPDMVARRAAANGVGLIAVADHNMLAGSRRLMKCCQREGIRCIPAVELDALEGGNLYHILGYGVDLDDAGFITCAGNRNLLDHMNESMVERVACDTPGVSLDDYQRFCRDFRLGGWKALHYFLARGLTSKLRDGIRLYDMYGCYHSDFPFPSVEQACTAVRAAGGKPVLAHPGEMINTADPAEFTATLGLLMAKGVAGIESYYPTHSPEITAACLHYAAGRGLLVTSGSDCHGRFGRTEIGQMKVTLEQLNLSGLMD